MTVTVTDHLQLAIPAELCVELGIGPGARLDVRAREGRLEAVKVPQSLADIYTPERNAEEALIQQACSCEVPEDFPR